jgi:hypothetical protein
VQASKHTHARTYLSVVKVSHPTCSHSEDDDRLVVRDEEPCRIDTYTYMHTYTCI